MNPVTPLTPKRIALFSGAYTHIADGVTLTLNRLVAYLESRGNDVLVFAPTTERPAIEHAAGRLFPTRSFPIPGRPEYLLSRGLTPAMRAELRTFHPHLIHLATPDMPAVGALRLARGARIPVVSSYHTHFTSYLNYYRIGWMEPIVWAYLRWFYRQCSQVYVPSASMADVLRIHGIRERLYLWERGVDIQRFNPERRSLEWRRHMGIGDEEVVVSFVSRLVLEKGLDVFADVIEGLQARGIPHRCLIVGDGPARADMAARLPGAIFTGTLRGNDLGRAYASSDVFLFPSHTETFGNVTLEAMASGLPAVCADATGSRSLVIDGVTGYLAPPNDSAAFLDRVSRLVRNPLLRTHMGHQARDRAQAYDWPLVLGKIESYYDALLYPEIPTGEVDLSPATSMTAGG
jgi:glycosyltransferase involved in cell wall biosynthesis